MMKIAELNRTDPLLIGLSLGRGTGGPYKTIMQFHQAIGGRIVSFSDRATERIPNDNVIHLDAGPSLMEQKFLRLRAKERKRFQHLVSNSTHLQCHILFRHHAYYIWEQAMRQGLQYWVVPHGCLDPYVFTYRKMIKEFWMACFGRIFLNDATHVIFSSQQELRKAKRWLMRDNARVVHWPVSLPPEARSDRARSELRNRLGITVGARILLWLGRLHPMKRPEESARIFANYARESEHLVFVGQGSVEMTKKLVQIAGTCKNRNIHYIGALYDKERDDVIAGCDGYWSYSTRENFNHAAAESLAAGLPVILSPGNDLCLDLSGAGVGWLLKDDSEACVVKALSEWGQLSEGEVSGIGARSRSWAKRELSFEAFAGSLQMLDSQIGPGVRLDPKMRQVHQLWYRYISSAMRFLR